MTGETAKTENQLAGGKGKAVAAECVAHRIDDDAACIEILLRRVLMSQIGIVAGKGDVLGTRIWADGEAGGKAAEGARLHIGLRPAGATPTRPA